MKKVRPIRLLWLSQSRTVRKWLSQDETSQPPMPNPSYFCAEASLLNWLLILALVSNQSNLCSIKGEKDLDDLPGSSQVSVITLLATDLWEPILKFRKQISTFFFPQIILEEAIMMPFWWGQCHHTPWGIINCPNTHYLCMYSSTVCQEKGAYKLTKETGISVNKCTIWLYSNNDI